MGAYEVGAQVVERGAHLGSVLLVHAEDDGLGEAIRLFQEIGEVPRDGLGAPGQRDFSLEIRGAVKLVGDASLAAVEVVPARAPSGGVPLRDDAVDATGSEEAVGNPAVGDAAQPGDGVRLRVPVCGLQLRGDQGATCIGLAGGHDRESYG